MRIGLVCSYDLAYMRGIKSYALTRRQWALVPFQSAMPTISLLRASHCDGLIAQVSTEALVETLAALGRPVVNVSMVLLDSPFPRVGEDHGLVGRLAARHFLERGFRHFGSVGHRGYHYSDGQEAGFHQELAAVGHRPACYYEPANWPYLHHSRLLALDAGFQLWLRSLPKPCGLFACNDFAAFQSAEACWLTGLRVPDDVAIVGVDNDDLLCELARPSLSSVALPCEAIGYQAAALLDRLLDGALPQSLLLPPLGVVTRQSSDLLALPDADVTAAVRFIREHGDVPLRVEDVLQEVPVSRRSLERRFRRLLGRGLGDEIRQTHLKWAKDLLATTRLAMADVARRAGFSDYQHFCRVFHKELGLTPTAYRRQFQF